MKHLSKYFIIAAFSCMALGMNAEEKQDWGDFKLWIDPGHSGRENMGLYGYSEAQKVLQVGLATREFLFRFTTADNSTIQMTRDDEQDNVSLEERSDMANAWGADFFYSIHSDAGSGQNTTVTLFGGWKLNGEYIEKTPNGGKRYGDILCPNLTSVMYNTGTRGNYYDRVFYNGDVYTHENQYPYLSVNRRTNMASLLSEGGFHTHPVQQGLNINESYKHLEAFGTFRSIMEYRGLPRPDMVMLAGVITNSENGQGIDGVTVTVNGETVVTDTYESIFHQYVKREGIVHNGFFLFEDLEPGQQYEVTYSCPGYTSASKTVTMQSDPQGLSGDNVTWANIQLTNIAPAVISSNSVYNPEAVNKRDDIVLTFSRNMDRASVEQAFSINHNGNVTLTWDNDYTLRVNISQLLEDMNYTITIDGSVAKNSQTQQLLDGDNDGTEGGDYVFYFITIPADLEAPYIVNTTPTENETMKYTLRPVVRIEYNEELDWNEDQAVDAIVVVDADGNTYDGTLTHTVIRNASVLHYYLNQNIARDKCFKVTVKGGFADLSGNVSEPKTFKFLSEYRTEKSNVEMIGEYVAADWFASIAGSGSSKGFTDPENQFYAKSSLTYSSDVPSSMQIHYQYDPETSDAYWGGRAYNRKTDGGSYYSNSTGKNAVIQAMVYGDGSEQFVGHGIRWRNDEGSVKRHTTQPMVRGWNMVAWDVNNEECSIVSGTQTMVTDGQWKYDAFWIWKGYVDQLTEENEDMLDYPAEYWEGDVYLGPVHKVIYNDEEQTASLSDIPDDVTVKLGDVNDDGEINVLDVTVLINYILNKNPQPFNIANANVNQSGEIDVLDVTALINIILSGN